MPDTIASKILSLQFVADPKSAKDTLATVQSLRTGLSVLASDVKRLDVTTSGLTNSYGKMSAKAVQARNEMLKGTVAAKEQISVLQRLQQTQSQTAAGGGNAGGSDISVGKTASKVGRGLRVLGFADLGGISTSLGRLSSAASAAGPLIEETGASVLQMGVAGGLASVAIVAVGIAVEDFTKKMEAGKKRFDNAIESQLTYYELIQTGTSESIKAGLADLKIKLLQTEATKRDVQAAQERLKEDPFANIFDFVTQTTQTKINALGEESSATQAQIDALTKALDSNQVAANDARAALDAQTEATKKQIEDQKRAVRTASDAIKQVRAKADADEAVILQRAADQRVSIAQRVANAEQDAFTNLQRTQAEDRIKLGEVQADARLNYQRTEAQSAESHLKNLLKIRKDAQADEFELQLNRDFAGIAKLRRDTEKRLSEEDDRYNEERKQRLTAIRQQLSDQQKAFIREREQRIRQYHQQLLDIHATKERELRLNNEAAKLDIERLHAKLKAELAMKADAYSIEVQLVANLINRLKALSGEKTTTQFNANQGHESQGPGLGGYASGGTVRAGQSVMVNDPPGGRESWTSGGRTMWLPNGMGVFTPAQDGRVNPSGGGVQMGDMYVNGANKSEIRREAHRIVDQQLTEAFEALTA